MDDLGGFDVVLQFRPTVVCDALARQLNDPLALSAQAHKLAQRYLTLEAVLPSALSWGDPEIDCAEGNLLLASVAISGGIRPPVLNHNVTVTASARMPFKPVVKRADSGALYIEAEMSAPAGLTLGDVHLGMAGVNAPVPLAGLDPGKVTEPLRPLLAQNLFQSLAHLAHTYTLDALPSDVSPQRAGARALTDEKRAALALGFALGSQTGDASSITSAFVDDKQGNVALALSGAGLNWLIRRALAQGRLQGVSATTSQRGPTPWRWTALTCVPDSAGGLELNGRLEAGGQTQSVSMSSGCALDNRGQVVITPDRALDTLVVDAIQGALALALSADGHTDGAIQQTLTIPGSSVSVSAPARALRVAPGSVTLLFDAPLRKDRTLPHFPARIPIVRIAQQAPTPVASHPGAPITTTVRAQVVNGSFPPYDFEWRTDQAGGMTSGPQRDIIGNATDTTPGPHTLTTAHLRLIDLIGQVATADQPVQYAGQAKRRAGRTVAIATTLALVAALALGGVAAANGRFPFPWVGAPQATATPTDTPTPTPVIAFAPALSGSAYSDSGWAQDCHTATSGQLDTTTLTLDNTQSNVPISWSITFANDPTASLSAGQQWATATDPSSGATVTEGTTDAGGTTTLSITPDPSLCDSWLKSTINYQVTYNFTLSLTYTPESPDNQQPVTFTDQIKGPWTYLG